MMSVENKHAVKKDAKPWKSPHEKKNVQEMLY